MFLKEFVGDTPWAHLDIAGTAWAEDARAWTPKGATGVMIRTLVELARTAGQRLAVIQNAPAVGSRSHPRSSRSSRSRPTAST